MIMPLPTCFITVQTNFCKCRRAVTTRINIFVQYVSKQNCLRKVPVTSYNYAKQKATYTYFLEIVNGYQIVHTELHQLYEKSLPQ
jgi:hypothetical protein